MDFDDFEFWEKDKEISEEEAIETTRKILGIMLKNKKECYAVFLFFKGSKLSIFMPSNFEEQKQVVGAAIKNVDKVCFTGKVGLKDGEYPSIFYYDTKTKKKLLKVYNVVIDKEVKMFEVAEIDDYDFGWALE